MRVKMLVVQNAATGILVTAFSPDWRHFHLKHNIAKTIHPRPILRKKLIHVICVLFLFNPIKLDYSSY